nr:hypothetical protein [Tanacetum cinerariifolium]
MDTVTRLMKEVECEEKAAEQAKAEAVSAWSCSDSIAKLNELKQAQLHVVITNEMLASEVNAPKQHLDTEMETLQFHVASLLDNGNRSLERFNEMDRALNIRCTLASMKRKLAILKKQEGEASAAAVVAYEEMQMEKLILESKRLKQEAAETSKVVMHGEISDKCKNVKLLKEELDQAIPLSGILSSRQALSILPYQPQPEQADSDVLFKNSSGRRIKKVKRKTKLHGTRMSAKSVKEVKIKTKLHGNRVFGQSNKKIKIEGGVHGTRMSAKSLKKDNNGSFEADIKIGPAKETGERSNWKRKQVMKCSRWGPARRRLTDAQAQAYENGKISKAKG